MKIFAIGKAGRRSAGPLYALIYLLVMLVLALAGGCTSDEANLVGTSLLTAQMDTLLRPLEIRAIDRFSFLSVINEDEPFAEKDVLYVGHGTLNPDTGIPLEQSSILVNYDFSQVADTVYTEEYLQASNIKKMTLRLHLLVYYGFPDTVGDYYKYYDVFQLNEPFDPTDYPGPVPPYISELLNIPEKESASGIMLLDFNSTVYTKFTEWVANGETVGMVMRERIDSNPTSLWGFSSREMSRAASALDLLHEETVLGPAIILELFEAPPNADWEGAEFLVIPPLADISTFDVLPEQPADASHSFMLRSHLRSYPSLYFDLSKLPPNVFINRAVIGVTNDTTLATGPVWRDQASTIIPYESIVASELDLNLAPVGGDTTTVDELGSELWQISGIGLVNPQSHALVEINVTSSVQRYINQVYTGDRTFQLTAGESFTSGFYNAIFPPGFFYARYQFHGTDDPDTSRHPYLRITYTRNDELSAEGQEP